MTNKCIFSDARGQYIPKKIITQFKGWWDDALENEKNRDKSG